MAHIYTVEFRILSEHINPETITEALRLRPSQVRANGTTRSDGKRLTGMWAFDGGEQGGPSIKWKLLEEGLESVIGKLWPVKNQINSYSREAKLIWWCGHFQSSFDGGPELSSGLLTRLAQFDASLYIDSYFSGDDPPPNPKSAA